MKFLILLAISIAAVHCSGVEREKLLKLTDLKLETILRYFEPSKSDAVSCVNEFLKMSNEPNILREIFN